MTRANARELAVHLIYGREFTGEEPEQIVAARLNKEYYSLLAEENEVYSDHEQRLVRTNVETIYAKIKLEFYKNINL